MSARLHRATTLACLALLALSAHALAQADPEAPRLPRPRPAVAALSGTGQWATQLQSRLSAAAEKLDDVPVARATSAEQTPPPVRSALQAIEQVARLPHARPEHPPELLAPELAMVPPHRPAEAPAVPAAPHVPAPEDLACLARLDALGVTYTKAEPIDPDGRCYVDHPLVLTSVGSGVAITPHPTLDCRTAEALALWTRDVLIPSAHKILGATPTKIVQDSAYVCRNRYNDPDAKLSEHAHANAIDIPTIEFAERQPFNVANRDMDSLEGRFQVTIRGGSCDYFTTVLGPRSNVAHATHFHFDMAQRRRGYRLCDLADTNFVGATEP